MTRSFRMSLPKNASRGAAAIVAVVAGVQGLMHVSHKVHQELERLTLLRRIQLRVP